MKLLLIVVETLLLFAATARAQSGTAGARGSDHTAKAATSAAEIRSFAGCYELHIGRWWPWGFGSRISNAGLPSRIELLPQRGTYRFEAGQLLVRSIPRGTLDPQWRESSFWAVQSNKKVGLVWTTGFVGDTLNLHKTPSGLSGWGHPFFDAATWIPRIAHVTAHRISCGS